MLERHHPLTRDFQYSAKRSHWERWGVMAPRWGLLWEFIWVLAKLLAFFHTAPFLFRGLETKSLQMTAVLNYGADFSSGHAIASVWRASSMPHCRHSFRDRLICKQQTARISSHCTVFYVSMKWKVDFGLFFISFGSISSAIKYGLLFK